MGEEGRGCIRVCDVFLGEFGVGDSDEGDLAVVSPRKRASHWPVAEQIAQQRGAYWAARQAVSR